MYFNKLPEMLYNFKVGNTEKVYVVRDITVNVRMLNEVLQNVTLYDEYDIVDGETPEVISEKLYGSPTYHWAIMIANQKFDYTADFPLPYDRLQQYVIDKYGDLNTIHHYEDPAGNVVNSDTVSSTPISNIMHEEKLNEAKRRIKVISKTLLQQITNEFDNIV